MKRTAWAALLLLALGCAGESLSPPNVVARVGDRELAYEQFEEYLRRNSIDLEVTLGGATLSRLFDQFLEEELVRATAVDRGLVGESSSSAAALAALIEEVSAVDDQEVARFYSENPERFQQPERVRLSQILVESREVAEEARAALAAGEPFEEVAGRLSIDPAAARGGDQGVLTREDLPPAFVEAVFSLAPGESSAVVSADYGFHIFRVTARWPGERLSLEEAAPEIRELLAGRRRAAARERVVAEARRRYNVAVDERNLPFRYQGTYATKP